uniref:Uncharacterized protein n=1 Tax=Triticum urartu TaxID=4572 RepID=A0A8R7UGS2_TRIUA
MELSSSQKMLAADSPIRERADAISVLRSARALPAAGSSSAEADRKASMTGDESRTASYMSSTLKSFSAERRVMATASVKSSMWSMMQRARSAKTPLPTLAWQPLKTRPQRSCSVERPTLMVCLNALIHVTISVSSASHVIRTTSSMLDFSYPSARTDASNAFRRATSNICVHSVTYPAATMMSAMDRSRSMVSGVYGGLGSAAAGAVSGGWRTHRSASCPPCSNEGGRLIDLQVSVLGSSSAWNSSSRNAMARCSTAVTRCAPETYLLLASGFLASADARAEMRAMAASTGGSPLAHLSREFSVCAIRSSTAAANFSSVASGRLSGAWPSRPAINASISPDNSDTPGSPQ